MSSDGATFDVHYKSVFDLKDHRLVDQSRIPRPIDHDGTVHGSLAREREDLPRRQVGQHSWPIANTVVVQLPLSPVYLEGYVGPRFRFDVNDALSPEQVVHLTDVFLDDVEVSRHAALREHFNRHAGHGGDPGSVFDGLTDSAGVGQGIASRGDDDLLLTHEVRHRSRGLLAVMTSFWHHDEQDAVGPETGSIVERLPDLGRGRVAYDEDVFTSADVHAGVDNGAGAARQFFTQVEFVLRLVALVVYMRFWFLLLGNPLGEVHDVLNVLVNRFVVVLSRTFSAEREDHVARTVQMFLNVCIFVSLWGSKCIFTTGGSVEEARSIEATMEAYEEFIQRVQDIHRLGALQGHLGWDQEVLMPAKGAASRGEMMAWLAGKRHEQLTDQRMGELLDRLETTQLDQDQAANVREMRRSYDQAVRLPKAFVESFAQARSEALLAWQSAREASDFAAFKPALSHLIDLTKQKIELLGVTSTPYDVLLDEYEVGMTVEDYDPLFAGLRERLVPLLQAITHAQQTAEEPSIPTEVVFSVEAQKAFCEAVSNHMGFDFEAGRMDASTHPFSAGLWPGDTRFTTRFDEKDPFSCLYAVMHETGHALYEQGLDHEHRYTPRGAAVSLGVHESQSRFWENQIGRTPAFWKVVLPWFRSAFPEAPDFDEHTLNRLANRVEKGFIRVEADEVTYNLHVMLRYEIEKQLFNGELEVDDLPTAWNTMFKAWFDVDVPEDRLGCLQDIHWSMGAFGYFPTYTLGNLYAAQLLEAMAEELGDIDELVAAGDWEPMLAWLRPRIHQRGSQVSPAQLIEDATGSPPSPEPFLRYVERKYGELYQL